MHGDVVVRTVAESSRLLRTSTCWTSALRVTIDTTGASLAITCTGTVVEALRSDSELETVSCKASVVNGAPCEAEIAITDPVADTLSPVVLLLLQPAAGETQAHAKLNVELLLLLPLLVCSCHQASGS